MEFYKPAFAFKYFSHHLITQFSAPKTFGVPSAAEVR